MLKIYCFFQYVLIIKKPKFLNVEKLIEYILIFKIPKFPVSGDYLKNMDIKLDKSLEKNLNF